MKLLVTSDTLTYTCRQNTNAHKKKNFKKVDSHSESSACFFILKAFLLLIKAFFTQKKKNDI